MGSKRRKACKGCIYSLENRSGIFFYYLFYLIEGRCKKIGFILSIRNKIFPSGKHLTNRTDHCGYMLYGIHYPFGFTIRLGKYDITVLSHDLGNEAYMLYVSHFIKMLCFYPYGSFKPGLGHAYDPSALYPLS